MGRRGTCLQSMMLSIESSFQPSGKLLCLCVDVLAGEADLARFDLMCFARMPSSMCWSQYLCGALPLRPVTPQITHSPVGAMRA